MKDWFEKIGGNFFFAAFIPALGFVLSAMVIFGPIIPPGVNNRLKAPFIGQEGLVVLVLTIILGFMLSSLNTYIYKIVEGYFWLERIPRVRRSIQNKAQRIKDQLTQKDAEIAAIEEKDENDPRLSDLRDERYHMAADYQQRFPAKSIKAILPTRFGNIFRAAEDYPLDRYGMDAVVLWPRLVHSIPQSYYDKIEESNNGLAFLINSSLLSFLMAILCVSACLFQLWLKPYAPASPPDPLHLPPGPVYFVPIQEAVFVYEQRALMYFVLFLVMLALCLFFYIVTLPVAQQHGDLIRSAFDLFRFKLLNELNFALPENRNQEYELWGRISRFMAIGDPPGIFLTFDYQTSSNKAGEGSSSSAPGRKKSARKAKRLSPRGTRRSKT
jgi:hypothetical protein